MSGNSETSYLKSFRLDGKVCIVTGGVGILGKYFCQGLAEMGASVVVIDREKSLCEELASSLRDRYQVRAIGRGCDITDERSVQELVRFVRSEFGRIDVLHNNAASKGSNLRDFFTETEKFSMSVWREVMSVNVDGLFMMARAVGEVMVEQKSGSIIQTGSIYGIAAPDQRIYEGSNYLGGPINTPAVYSASKSAVVGLTRYLASLWGPHGVRVNTLIPGGVGSGQNGTFDRNYSARVPMGRMARPEEMVGPLLFLASDASSYVTGQEIIVDGGLTCW